MPLRVRLFSVAPELVTVADPEVLLRRPVVDAMLLMSNVPVAPIVTVPVPNPVALPAFTVPVVMVTPPVEALVPLSVRTEVPEFCTMPVTLAPMLLSVTTPAPEPELVMVPVLFSVPVETVIAPAPLAFRVMLPVLVSLPENVEAVAPALTTSPRLPLNPPVAPDPLPTVSVATVPLLVIVPALVTTPSVWLFPPRSKVPLVAVVSALVLTRLPPVPSFRVPAVTVVVPV